MAQSHKILGNRDPLKAEPGTIRALYGSDAVRNCMHVSTDEEGALQVYNLLMTINYKSELTNNRTESANEVVSKNIMTININNWHYGYL